MKTNDPFLFRQLQVVQKIIEDETWLEGERRGCAVTPDDEVVRENVCRVVLRIGREMRANALAAIGHERGGAVAALVVAQPEAA
jgi:hypothetical protein